MRRIREKLGSQFFPILSCFCKVHSPLVDECTIWLDVWNCWHRSSFFWNEHSLLLSLGISHGSSSTPCVSPVIWVLWVLSKFSLVTQVISVCRLSAESASSPVRLTCLSDKKKKKSSRRSWEPIPRSFHPKFGRAEGFFSANTDEM